MTRMVKHPRSGISTNEAAFVSIKGLYILVEKKKAKGVLFILVVNFSFQVGYNMNLSDITFCAYEKRWLNVFCPGGGRTLATHVIRY